MNSEIDDPLKKKIDKNDVQFVLSSQFSAMLEKNNAHITLCIQFYCFNGEP